MTASPSIAPFSNLALTAGALNHGGGAERYTRDIVSGLHRMGITPTLFAKKIDRSLEEAQWVDAHELNVRWAPNKLSNWAFNWRLSRQLRKRPPHTIFAINHVVCADVALCGGTHPGALAAAGKRSRLGDKWQIALERRTYDHARVIMAHSELMSRELQRFYGIPQERIHVIYPPVDTARFRPLDQEQRMQIRRDSGLPEDRMVFAFSSTSHKRKGYALLEDFFASTDLPICLAVAGRPVPKTSDKIRYVGYRRDMENFFAAADYTIVASEYEPFGLVGVESVMCGTPLVIADNVGSAEAVRDDAKIVFSRQQSGTFEHAIRQAIATASNGASRIQQPRRSLVYNPEVDTHVLALCELIRSLPNQRF